jgi:hypothetical protein
MQIRYACMYVCACAYVSKAFKEYLQACTDTQTCSPENIEDNMESSILLRVAKDVEYL